MIVVDDENGDIEGNIAMAASLTSPKHVAFMVKHGSGIVSVGMKEEDLEKLKLPLMSPETEDEDSSAPTFTITVVSLASPKGPVIILRLELIFTYILGCENWNVHWSISRRQGQDSSCSCIS